MGRIGKEGQRWQQIDWAQKSDGACHIHLPSKPDTTTWINAHLQTWGGGVKVNYSPILFSPQQCNGANICHCILQGGGLEVSSGLENNHSLAKGNPLQHGWVYLDLYQQNCWDQVQEGSWDLAATTATKPISFLYQICLSPAAIAALICPPLPTSQSTSGLRVPLLPSPISHQGVMQVSSRIKWVHWQFSSSCTRQ